MLLLRLRAVLLRVRLLPLLPLLLPLLLLFQPLQQVNPWHLQLWAHLRMPHVAHVLLWLLLLWPPDLQRHLQRLNSEG